VNSSTMPKLATTTIHRGTIPSIVWMPWHRPTPADTPVRRVRGPLIHSKITRSTVETSPLADGYDQTNHRCEASAVGGDGGDLFGFAGVVSRPCSLFAPINHRWPVDEDHQQAI
jgi:hypothetical protein